MESAEGNSRHHLILIIIAACIVAAGVVMGLVATTSRRNATPPDASHSAPTHGLEQPFASDGTDRDPSAAPPDAGADDPEPAAGAPGAPPGPDVDPHAHIDASDEINEERFIQISVDIIMAAIGFQNAGQGEEELVAYLPELLAKQGVTEEALETATNRVMENPRQAERVSMEIVKRVEALTGINMDIDLVKQMNPNWEPTQ